MDLSVLIPARNEEWLGNTIEDVLHNARAKTEIIVVLDGQWPVYPIPDHDRVTMIYHSESIGQRAATNEAAKLSRAKFIMKLDAHCSVGKGFDVKLMADCKPDWTVIPKMYNLHVFDWQCEKCGARTYQGVEPKRCKARCGGKKFKKVLVWKRRKNRVTTSWRFDNNLKFEYWRAYSKRPEARAQGDIVDTMSSIGACFFMHRQRFFDLGGLDERHGSWGQVGTEVACKTWLSGGRQVVNKRAWFGHLFRTGKGFSFPYPLRGSAVNKARKHSKHLWLGNNWPGAKHDLAWLIDKFSPVPDWEKSSFNKNQDLTVSKNGTVGLVYYTDNSGDPFLMEACRRQVKRCMETHRIPDRHLVSVSHKPLDFGRNIVMDLERAVLSIFKQVLKGLQESTADIIFLLEHDLVYHPSHFDFRPSDKNIFYYDRNRWSVCDVTGKAVFYHTNVPSMLCADRQLLIDHYSRVVKMTEKNGWRSRYGYSPPKGLPKEKQLGKYKSYFAALPCLDIRRKDAWTRKRMDKSQFRSDRSCRGWTESESVPGWRQTQGRFNDFLKGIYHAN